MLVATYKLLRVFSGREMSQALHGLEVGPLDLFRRGPAHLWCRTPVVLAGKKVNGTLLDINFGDAVAGVEAAEIEVEVSVEDSIRLPGIQVLPMGH